MTSSLAFLHILKTWISLERKEIFEKSKRNLSSYAVYLFMFENGLEWKDAIFVIVPLKGDNDMIKTKLKVKELQPWTAVSTLLGLVSTV